MTNIEKAALWFEANGYEVSADDTTLYISVWNLSLEDSIDVQVSTAEVEFRADLWDSENNQKEK